MVKEVDKVSIQGLSDKDMGQDILTGEKFLTDLYAQGSVEAADPALRRLMGQLHEDSVQDAGRVFQHLQQRGWYGLRPAGFQDINEMRQTVGQTRQSLLTMGGQWTSPYQQPVESTTGMGIMGQAPTATHQEVSQVRYGGSNNMQGYQQSMPSNQSYYGQGGYQQLPQWTRQEVPGESGQLASGGPVGYSAYQGGPTHYYQNPQMSGMSGGYPQQHLPQWTRQEVSNQAGQYPSGGPVGFTAYPGGPTQYYAGSPGNVNQGHYPIQQQQLPNLTRQEVGFQAGGGQFPSYPMGQPQPSQYTGYGQLPEWTRQEVGFRGDYGSGGFQNQASGQIPIMGSPQPAQYSGYGQLPDWTRQEVGFRGNYGAGMQSQNVGQPSLAGYGPLPAWTRQEVRGEYGQQSSGGPVAFSSPAGGPSIYQGGGIGVPQQSIYGQGTISQGFNQSSYPVQQGHYR